MELEYSSEKRPSLDAFMEIFRRSTLAERRRIDRPDIFEGMLNAPSLLISAWEGERLVGIARTLTDFTHVAYVADLAVDVDYQRQGIGKRLIEETRSRLAPECMIVLLAAPKANDYYAKLGFEHNPRAWVMQGVR